MDRLHPLEAELGTAEQQRMVDALQRLLQSGQPTLPVERIETHISFVLVDARFAYKIKRAINPGFLDFTTRALRRDCCLAELRLNRRLAPDLYLDVVPVTGGVDAPAFAGEGPVIDHAVKMRAFSQQGLWDGLARRGALTAAHIDQLVDQLDRFHRQAPAAPPDAPFGQPRQVREPMLDNLAVLRPLVTDAPQRDTIDELGRWEAAEFAAIEPVLQQRRLQGRVRECHGDLHLGNVVQIEGRCTVFDCIEFNDDFRWIDVMSEVAFMAMDLQAHGCAGLAHRFVNGWFERSGDHAGARLLRYFIVYRALVRAKVAALRAVQAGDAPAAGAAAVRPLLELALANTRPGRGALLITHGPSGSGKSTGSHALLQAIGAIRIRADVERKRLFGLGAAARSGSAPGAGLYTAQATAATYQQLFDAAEPALAGGCSVVLDATFGQRRHRDQARQLAQRLQVPFVLLDFVVDPAALRDRVRARSSQGGDASEADLPVLEAQLLTAEPLADDERDGRWVCPAVDSDDAVAFDARWQAFARGLQQAVEAGPLAARPQDGPAP